MTYTNASDMRTFNGTTFNDFFAYPNEITQGAFWYMMLIASFLIIMVFAKTKGYSTSKSLLMSSFLNLFFAAMLRWLGLISNLAIFIIIVGLAVFALFAKSENG